MRDGEKEQQELWITKVKQTTQKQFVHFQSGISLSFRFSYLFALFQISFYQESQEFFNFFTLHPKILCQIGSFFFFPLYCYF